MGAERWFDVIVLPYIRDHTLDLLSALLDIAEAVERAGTPATALLVVILEGLEELFIVQVATFRSAASVRLRFFRFVVGCWSERG